MTGNQLFDILNSAPTFGLLLAIFFAVIIMVGKADIRQKSSKSSKR